MAVDDTDADASQLDSKSLEAAVERFEAAWKGDVAPQLENFLVGMGLRRKALLRELIAVDLEYRLKRGEPLRIENAIQSAVPCTSPPARDERA